MSRLGDEVAAAQQTPPDRAGLAWRSEITSEHADIQTGELTQPVSDWSGVLRHFGLDPAEFEVCDDTVKMSSWQQSKALEDGTRDLVWLYAYKARFRRVVDRMPAVDVDAARARVQSWRPRRTSPAGGHGLGTPSTFYIGWADWQLGKEGVAVTTDRILGSFEASVKRVKELRRLGRNVERLAIWNMGDPIEGCDSNYASQLFTVEMTRREQLNHALDLWLTGLRTLAPLFDQVEFGSVLCNHGEWSRQGVGTKPVTSDSDNVGGYLADTLKTVLAGRPEFDHVSFEIPRSQMTMASNMSGVEVALNHGHKAPGSKAETEWLQAQSLRLLRERGREPRLWMLAHRHHYSVVDHGPWHRIQHPAQDLGSKWYTDTSGKWASPGTFTCLVGEHEQAGGPVAGMGRGFSDEAVLIPAA